MMEYIVDGEMLEEQKNTMRWNVETWGYISYYLAK